MHSLHKRRIIISLIPRTTIEIIRMVRVAVIYSNKMNTVLSDLKTHCNMITPEFSTYSSTLKPKKQRNETL